MKIAILQTGDVAANLLAKFGDYPNMFFSLFKNVEKTKHTFSWTVFDVRKEKYPASPYDADGYLITGSRHGAYEPLTWIKPLSDYICLLRATRRPLIGICFGHQIIAQALGGRVEKSKKGWGVGRHEWPLIRHENWMTPAASKLRLMAFHQDQVMKLPLGARRLAGNAFCPNAAYAIGRKILGIQGHPEFSPEFTSALLQKRGADIPLATTTAAYNSLKKPINRTTCAKWMVAFFHSAAQN